MTQKLHDFLRKKEGFKNESKQEKKKRIQKIQIIHQLFLKGEKTCYDLSQKLNISYPTTSNLTQQLVGEGFIQDNNQKRNKHFTLSDENNLLLLSIKLKFNKAYAILFDQFHNIEEEFILNDFEFNPLDLEKSFKTALEFLQINEDKLNNILGISYILPPYLDSGVKFPSPTELTEIENNLEKYFNKNISISNYSYSLLRVLYDENREKLNNSIILTIGKEVGLGIVSNGSIVDRRHFPGSEFGHIPIFNNKILCSCGKKGCLESQISHSAIIHKIKKKLSEGQKSVLKNKNLSIQSIINAAKVGDQLSIEVFFEAGFALGKSISILIQLIAPENIFFITEFSKVKDILSNGVSSALNLYCPLFKSQKTLFEFQEPKNETACIGGFYIGYDKIFNNKMN